jgi:hypothetical protein
VTKAVVPNSLEAQFLSSLSEDYAYDICSQSRLPSPKLGSPEDHFTGSRPSSPRCTTIVLDLRFHWTPFSSSFNDTVPYQRLEV